MKKTLTLSAVVTLLVSCVTAQPALVNTWVEDYPLAENRNSSFSATLTAAQLQNLDVSVLERDSGLIRFESALLSVQELQRYCEYPFVNASTGQAFDTFINANTRSIAAGAGQFSGKVSMSVLVRSGPQGNSNINIRSNWTHSNNYQVMGCNSKGVLEEEFVQRIRTQLAL